MPPAEAPTRSGSPTRTADFSKRAPAALRDAVFRRAHRHALFLGLPEHSVINHYWRSSSKLKRILLPPSCNCTTNASDTADRHHYCRNWACLRARHPGEQASIVPLVGYLIGVAEARCAQFCSAALVASCFNPALKALRSPRRARQTQDRRHRRHRRDHAKTADHPQRDHPGQSAMAKRLTAKTAALPAKTTEPSFRHCDDHGNCGMSPSATYQIQGVISGLASVISANARW